MTICKFFLQGTCRFGNNCKFEHSTQDRNYGNGSSILLQNYSNKPAQSGNNVDTATLIKSVANDMLSAEKGGQWLLSSYAPFKEKAAFPGFEDYSMEEIRYLFYEAVKNGSLEQYKQNLQMMLQEAMMRVKALQNPTPEAVNILISIYNKLVQTSPVQTSIFGGSNNQNVFGQQNNTFSTTPAAPKPTQSIFGGATNPPAAFGTQTNSIFGSQPEQNSVFGAQPPNQNIFSGNSSVFGQNTQPSAPIFGGAQTQQTFFQPQNVFQSQPSFSTQITASTQVAPAFGAVQQQPATFVAPVQSENVGQATVEQSNKHSASIFGNAGGNNTLQGGSTTAQENNENYSKLEELTEDEIKWFQSDDMDISRIPEKPPTYEMCFKA